MGQRGGGVVGREKRSIAFSHRENVYCRSILATAKAKAMPEFQLPQAALKLKHDTKKFLLN